MKYPFSLVVLASIMLFSCGVAKQSVKLDPNSPEVLLTTKNCMLTWENRSFGVSYFYAEVNEINLTNNSKPLVIDMNFSMSMNESNSGNVIMKDDAVRNAMSMHNYFKPGKIELKDKTTVWLSRKVSQLMKDKKPFEIETNKGSMTKFTEFSDLDFTIKLNWHPTLKSLTMPAIRAYNPVNGDILVMHNSKGHANPLILQMNISGLSLKLKEADMIKE